MKAVFFLQHGGPDVLRYGYASDPIRKPGEVLVDIHAASINGADHKVRQGGGVYKARFPHILGRDFSGVVIEAGSDSLELSVGDAVFGVLDRGIEGAYAEKLAINAAIIARKPETLGHTEAAALALAGITTIWAIEDTAHLQAGETILIQGGAGGVGGLAIQLAHHIGARVITTASSGNHDYVRSLGADEVIDYNSKDFTEIGAVCDVVFDTVGGEVQVRSYEVLKAGGRLVWIAEAPKGFEAARKDVTAMRPPVLRDRAYLERLLALHENGALSSPPIRHFKLAEAAEAHRISEGRHLLGKLVFEIK